MKIVVEVNGKTPKIYSEKRLADTVRKTIRGSHYSFLKKKNINISLAFLPDSQMKKLNRVYRRKNQTTDVLSFANYRNIKELKKEKGKNVFLGDILLGLEYIKKSAKIMDVPLEKEIGFVVSHGVLHLLGFRHGEEMFALQDKIL